MLDGFDETRIQLFMDLSFDLHIELSHESHRGLLDRPSSFFYIEFMHDQLWIYSRHLGHRSMQNVFEFSQEVEERLPQFG